MYTEHPGDVVELVDTLALGASAARREGSSPFIPTKEQHSVCAMALEISQNKTGWEIKHEQGAEFRDFCHGDILKVAQTVYSVPERQYDPRCLEIGCGTGKLATQLATCGFSVDAIDFSELAITRARSHATTVDFQTFDFIRDDLTKLPSNAYDLLVCKYVYAFLDKQKFISRIGEVITGNSTVVIVNPLAATLPAEKQFAVASDSDMNLLTPIFSDYCYYATEYDEIFVGTTNII
jgi:2-polyprenyl-3-methyl-5-hydroxy-6-metoxy-1,4-benzoquinol methylase